MCVYIVNSIIIFSTFSTKKKKKRTRFVVWGCSKLVKVEDDHPSPQRQSHRERSLLKSLRGSQSGSTKIHRSVSSPCVQLISFSLSACARNVVGEDTPDAGGKSRSTQLCLCVVQTSILGWRCVCVN